MPPTVRKLVYPVVTASVAWSLHSPSEMSRSPNSGLERSTRELMKALEVDFRSHLGQRGVEGRFVAAVYSRLRRALAESLRDEFEGTATCLDPRRLAMELYLLAATELGDADVTPGFLVAVAETIERHAVGGPRTGPRRRK